MRGFQLSLQKLHLGFKIAILAEKLLDSFARIAQGLPTKKRTTLMDRP
jgi:hypothetical protein